MIHYQELLLPPIARLLSLSWVDMNALFFTTRVL